MSTKPTPVHTITRQTLRGIGSDVLIHPTCSSDLAPYVTNPLCSTKLILKDASEIIYQLGRRLLRERYNEVRFSLATNNRKKNQRIFELNRIIVHIYIKIKKIDKKPLNLFLQKSKKLKNLQSNNSSD